MFVSDKNNQTNLKLWECKFFIVLIWVSIISEPHFTDSPRVHPWASVPFFEMKNEILTEKSRKFRTSVPWATNMSSNQFPRGSPLPIVVHCPNRRWPEYFSKLKTRLNVPRGCEVELRTIYWLISELSHKWHHRTSLTLQLVVDLSISF